MKSNLQTYYRPSFRCFNTSTMLIVRFETCYKISTKRWSSVTCKRSSNKTLFPFVYNNEEEESLTPSRASVCVTRAHFPPWLCGSSPSTLLSSRAPETCMWSKLVCPHCPNLSEQRCGCERTLLWKGTLSRVGSLLVPRAAKRLQPPATPNLG